MWRAEEKQVKLLPRARCDTFTRSTEGMPLVKVMVDQMIFEANETTQETSPSASNRTPAVTAYEGTNASMMKDVEAWQRR